MRNNILRQPTAGVMSLDLPVYLASWPRSGNTLLRLILFHCFMLKSTTLYSSSMEGMFAFAAPGSQFVKSHEPPLRDWPAIYVVRDGREACVSYRHYLRQSGKCEVGPPLKWIIEGHPSTWFGTWSDHLRAWQPRTRPNMLLLRYEDMVGDPAGVVAALGGFLSREQTGNTLPTFASLKNDVPWFFRSGTNVTWKTEMVGDDLDLFWQIHGDTMREYGYT
ncbi:MAG: sulfotransferase domain-containing protein [Planctomycetes bacterium]|nr:sulfotransferase domain-containing protein [Planctomycetota bacterium]